MFDAQSNNRLYTHVTVGRMSCGATLQKHNSYELIIQCICKKYLYLGKIDVKTFLENMCTLTCIEVFGNTTLWLHHMASFQSLY